MKERFSTPAVILLSLSVLFCAAYLPLSPAVHGAAAKADTSSIQAQMQELAGGFRRLRRRVSKPEENEATIALLLKMQTAAFKAKSLLPKKVADLPKEKQAQAVRPYRLKMIELLTTMLAVEKAILESRNGDAYELTKKMNVIKEDCHKAMGVGG